MFRLTTRLLGILVTSVCCCSLVWGADAGHEVARDSFIPGGRQPQLAVDSAGTIHLTYGSGKKVVFASQRAGEARFSEPEQVAEVGALALGMRRGPRIAVSGKSIVITAVDGKEGHGKDEDLHAWRSSDGGRTWLPPVTINGVTASAREGLHHLAAGPDGTLYCVWLDLREKGTRLFGASSTDSGATWQERLLYRSPGGSVCQCCQPQVAFDAGGGLHVMWRNELDGDRDMYLLNSKDNGRTWDEAQKLGKGAWQLDACPMDGGGLAADAAGHVTTIWRRAEEIFRCTPGEEEELLGRGMQSWAAAGPGRGHDGGIYLLWLSKRQGDLMLQAPGDRSPQKLAAGASDPVIASPADGKGPVVAAWEASREGRSGIEVRVVRGRAATETTLRN